MNKAFKVIWSEARNAYVVVSEMAKSHGTKSCSTKKLLAMLIAAGIMTCASAAPVMAANLAEHETKIEAGQNAKAEGGDSVAIGNGAVAKAANGIAIGYQSLSGDNGWGVAVGGNTQAIGTHSVALGQTARALEVEGIAIGHTSLSEGSGAVAIGMSTNAKGAASLAFGNEAKALEEASIAFGQSSNSSGNGSIAIGRLANAAAVSSIAIGNNAVAAKEYSVVIGAHTNTETTGTGVTGVGQQVQVLGDYSAAFGMLASAKYQYTSAIGSYSTASAANANAFGSYSTASGLNANAFGSYSTASGLNANAFGRESTASAANANAFGSYSTASVESSVALGANSVANRPKGSIGFLATASNRTWKANGGAVSVGSDKLTRQIINVAAGTELTDAVNVAQLKAAMDKAGKPTTLSNGKNTKVKSTVKDGKTDYTVNVAGNLTEITSVANESSIIGLSEDSISIYTGSNNLFEITNSGISMSYTTANYNTNSIMLGANGTTIRGGLNVANSKITGVKAGEVDTDAVNVGQLKDAMKNVNINFQAGQGIVIETVKGNDGTTYKISTNIIGSTTNTDTTTVTPSASGAGGTIGEDTGNSVPNPGSNTLSNQPAAGNNIQTGDPVKIETVTNPTKFKADEGDAIAISPNETFGIKGDVKGNITTKADGQNIRVTLNEELDVTKVTADTFDAGATTITNDGLRINNGPSVTKDGIDAGDKKITNVAPGELSENSTDAVNGSQLHETNINVANNSMRINKLGDRVNKVGAGAAALAALHPMDFDPDDKWSFAAGMGNYAGQNAAAIGAYYRPDEKVMFSVGATVGNGENMVNAGVSFALDRTNHVSNSRTAMAREILDLRAEVAELKAMVAKGGLGSIAEDKMKIFPDVAENHWAYEYIGKLAAAGIIEGYPDGNFGGDRMMSRYEFAAMLYRAMQQGVQLDSKIINEFAPEMGRIRVDRISGEDGDRDKIERVRVNAVKGERDHYGNKIAKAEAKAK